MKDHALTPGGGGTMESQGQGYPSWDTRGRRATIFAQREGARTLRPSALPAHQNETDFLTPGERQYRPSVTRKRAMCDFRVRWPEIICRDQQAQREDQPRSALPSLDSKAHDTSSCSSAASSSLKQQESSHSDFQDSQVSLACFLETPQMTILKNFLKPESMTRLERRVRNKTTVVMNELEMEMEAAKFRRAVLLRDTRELQDERALEEEENKPFLEYLKKRNQITQEKYDFLWNDYIQQCQEMQDRRQKLISDFTSRTTDLQKQLMQARNWEVSLRKKLKALKPIAQIRESQDLEIQALEQKKASIVSDITFMDREAHLQFLKKRADLEKQVEELNLLESGEDITRELKKKAKALEAMVKQIYKDFLKGVSAENRRLRTELHQLDQEFCELEARRKQLEQRKQRWKEQQWYLEALARGRQRLQQREQRLQQQEQRPPKPQAAPHPTQGRLRGARPRATPK